MDKFSVFMPNGALILALQGPTGWDLAFARLNFNQLCHIDLKLYQMQIPQFSKTLLHIGF